jgi:hypothetical protein
MPPRCSSASSFPCSPGAPQYDSNNKLIKPCRTLCGDSVCAAAGNFSTSVNVGRLVAAADANAAPTILPGNLVTVGADTVMGSLTVMALYGSTAQAGLVLGTNTVCNLNADVDVGQLAPPSTGGPASGGSLIFHKGDPLEGPQPLAQGGRLDVIFDHAAGPGGFEQHNSPPSSYVGRGTGVYYEVKDGDAASFGLAGMGLSVLTTFVPSLNGTAYVTQTLQGATGIWGRRSTTGPAYAGWGAWSRVATWGAA